MTTPRAEADNTETESKFQEWISGFASIKGVPREDRKVIMASLMTNRHFIIMDARQSFTESIKKGDIDHEYPIVTLVKELPLLVLEGFEDVESAVGSCKELGCTWEVHIYPSSSLAKH